MKTITTSLFLLLSVCYIQVAQAHVTPKLDDSSTSKPSLQTTTFQNDCDPPQAETEQAINNVRARLLTGGDMWWKPRLEEGYRGGYIVPKRPPNEPQISSIFAAGVWMGGLDPGGSLKLAAQQYGSNNGNPEYYSGPLDPISGNTEKEICANWDKFFKVTSLEIDEHIKKYVEHQEHQTTYKEEDIPLNVRGWPARGNPFFFDIHHFSLPNNTQGLADFWDQNHDGIYEPHEGDYPVLVHRGCNINPQYPDEMIFWIYNDAGGIHANSNADPIQMEVQVTAFAYQTNDQINDMTFQKYKLINRAVESIDSTYFGLWVDGDLGCYADDYIGCDTTRSMAYYYNADATDGQTGCSCPQNIPTYCDEVPILGIDFMRGPLDEFGQEVGMSSFTYYIGNSLIGTAAALYDPNTASEYYHYLTGRWRTGEPLEYGGNGYQQGTFSTNYAFSSPPDDELGWSMCSAAASNSADRDVNTIQSAGPFRLDPGAVNELLFGVIWIPDQDYPCPSIRALQAADDRAQAIFDNCFDHFPNGPDAPDMDIIELDQELIFVLSNDPVTSNNANEGYAELETEARLWGGDSLFLFEGYKVFQLANSKVKRDELTNPDVARLVFHVDIKNEVEKIYNWENISTPENPHTYTPVLMNEGVKNEGIRHTFKITEDQFATGDRKLVNHKKYYFVAIAYAHNEFAAFNPNELTGQMTPYLQGRKNMGDGENPHYTAIPRPIVDQNLNAQYGDGAVITRLDGLGTGQNFLALNEATEAAILDGTFTGELTYQQGAGPIDIQIIDPLSVKDGEYILSFKDDNLNDEILEEDAHWELTNLNNPDEIIVSERSIERFNEQVIPSYGFSVSIGQVKEAGDTLDINNGAIGARGSYADETVTPWFQAIADDAPLTDLPSPFDLTYDFVPTAAAQLFDDLDPNQDLSKMGEGHWIPYRLLLPEPEEDSPVPFLSPVWSHITGSELVNRETNLAQLNNVDIVFTSDKSKWSRCVIVETWKEQYNGLSTTQPEGNRIAFDTRAAPSVSQHDQDGDGRPDPDAAVDENGVAIEGMGWFPGYAIDVETGQRLNIFFGENSLYRPELENEFPNVFTSPATGADMVWNPSDQALISAASTGGAYSLLNFITGGQHFIYVTRQPYDECAFIYNRLKPSASPLRKVRAMQEVTWACMPLLAPNSRLTSYAEGLIPTDYRVQLRVNNPYQVETDNNEDADIDTRTGTGDYNYYPTYQFTLEGVEATEKSTPEIDAALNLINVVPNPYYAYSSYETSVDEGLVKITNLPAQCVVTIYNLKGDFIRRFQRNERPLPVSEDKRGLLGRQIYPDIEWDLKNAKGQVVGSGVYLIHVDAGALGERTLKWFGAVRRW